MTPSRVSSGTLCATLMAAFTRDREAKKMRVKIAHPHPSGGRS